MSEGAIVRRLGPADMSLALEAIRSLRDPAPGVDPGPDALRAFLASSDNVLIVATVEDTCVGFLVAYMLDRVDRDRPMSCLYEIGVATPHRRRGIGRALVDALRELCKEAGAVKIWTVTNRSNRAAMRLFESTGARIDADTDDVVPVWNLPASSVEEER